MRKGSKIILTVIGAHIILYEFMFSQFLAGRPAAGIDIITYISYIYNDRYMVLLLNGISAVCIGYSAVADLRRPVVLFRCGSYAGMTWRAEKAFFGVSALLLAVETGTLVLMLMASRRRLEFSDVSGIRLAFCMAANVMLFDFLLCNILLLLIQAAAVKERYAVALVVGLLVYNVYVSSDIYFHERTAGKLSWIGHLMAAEWDGGGYKAYVAYWFISIALTGGLLLLGLYGVWGRLLQSHCRLCRRLFMGGAIVLVFVLYAYFFGPYLDISRGSPFGSLAQYFGGFSGVDVYLFAYLFYQLPVWIYVYASLTEFVRIYGLHYFLRRGDMDRLFFCVLGRVLGGVFSYYAVGTGTLLVFSGIFGETRDFGYAGGFKIAVLLPVINLTLQTASLIAAGLLLWLYGCGGRHAGYFLLLMLHLALGDDVMPFSGGNYRMHAGSQLSALLQQTAWAALVFAGIYYSFHKRTEYISGKLLR